AGSLWVHGLWYSIRFRSTSENGPSGGGADGLLSGQERIPAAQQTMCLVYTDLFDDLISTREQRDG
ncbi:MAG: hypothetical protein WAN75_33530, partial [Xanthobacteraceae bacterium]